MHHFATRRDDKQIATGFVRQQLTIVCGLAAQVMLESCRQPFINTFFELAVTQSHKCTRIHTFIYVARKVSAPHMALIH